MRLCILPVLSLLVACGPVGEGMRYSATSINKLRTNTQIAYNELKFYRPQADPYPQASLRYCYQFISDIVCYDAPQSDIKSPLVGAQEGVPGRILAGNSITEISPLYAAAAPTDPVHIAPVIERPLASDTAIEQNSILPPPVTQTGKCTGDSPFPCKESGYVPDADVGK